MVRTEKETYASKACRNGASSSTTGLVRSSEVKSFVCRFDPCRAASLLERVRESKDPDRRECFGSVLHA